MEKKYWKEQIEKDSFIHFLTENNIDYYNINRTLIEIGKALRIGTVIRSYITGKNFEEKYQNFYDDYKQNGGTFVCFPRKNQDKPYYIICYTDLTQKQIISYIKNRIFS